MQIYNTQSRKKEEFVPIKPGEVGIYCCGPTVYNYFHIGNARPFIVFDTLRRYFEYKGMKITNFEMESSPLAGLAAHLGHNASTVCCIIANRYLQSSNPDYKPAIRKLVELCVDRMSTL